MPLLICENWPNNMTGQGVQMQQLQEEIDKKYFLTQDLGKLLLAIPKFSLG